MGDCTWGATNDHRQIQESITLVIGFIRCVDDIDEYLWQAKFGTHEPAIKPTAEEVIPLLDDNLATR